MRNKNLTINTFAISIFLLLGLAIISCNKIKRESKRISKEGNWEVSVMVNDSLYHEANWMLESCKKPFDELCEGTWSAGAQSLRFYWQFQEKASRFVLQKQDKEGTLEADEVMLHNLTYQLSGEYEVTEAEKDNYIFTAIEINGFQSKSLKIILK